MQDSTSNDLTVPAHTMAAIESDLRRLAHDLSRLARGEALTATFALEDAIWALCRARVAIREAGTSVTA